MKNSEMQSFTAGVVSIAATIMVLQLVTPTTGGFEALTEQWKTFLAHYNSFFLIYVLWYNHAKQFQRVEVLKPDIVIFNGIWLIFLAVIPFATSWVEHYPNHTAPELFFVVLLTVNILFNVEMNKALARENPEVKFSDRVSFRSRLPIYIALVIAFINSFMFPFINLFIFFGVTLYMTFLIVRTKHKDVTLL